MPINIRKTTSWRSFREIPAALVELWLRLRVRWRHNPGFVAAAAAGSIGLLLALVMAIQGGIRLLDEIPPGDELSEVDTYAALGEVAALEADDELGDPFAESGIRVRPAARRHVMDDDFDDTVTEEIDTGKLRHPLASDDEIAGDDSLGPHPLDEHPLASEPSPPRRFPRKSVVVDDEIGDSERDAIEIKADEAPGEPAAQPKNGKAAQMKLNIEAVFGGDAEDETEDAEVETATDSIQPAARVTEPAPTGWKNQPHQPLAEPQSPQALIERSHSVETVIVATPRQKEAAPAAGAPRHEATRARLSLAVSGPGAALIGEACKFEIRITNTGSESADQLTLSVELPDELVHQVGQSLEQHIEKLAPGQTYRALVRAQATSSGKTGLKIDVSENAAIVARSSASVVIGASASTTAQLILPDCECLPLNPAR